MSGVVLSAGAAANVSIALLQPNAIWAPRFNQIDFRMTKIITVGKLRTMGQFDLYNLGNSSAILGVNNTYGATWQRPTSVLAGRLMKFGLQMDWK